MRYKPGQAYICAVQAWGAMPPKNSESAAKKLLRGISGISGVSDRGVSAVLEWVRAHPEILEGNVEHTAVRPRMSPSGVDRL